MYVDDYQSAGYGNKIYSLLSAFTLALHTNSALIVNWPNIHKYIQEPLYNCFLTNASLNNELSFMYRPNETQIMPRSTHNSYNPKKDLNKRWLFSPNKNITRFVFNAYIPLFFEFACDTRFFETLTAYGLVTYNTLQNALLFLNQTDIPTNNISVEATYRVGFELAHNILKKFWNPTTSLQKLTMHNVRDLFKDYYVIGMQLRYHYLSWNDTYAFFRCAKEIQPRFNKTVKWYISTDNNENFEKIIKLYPNQTIYANGTISHVSFNADGYLRALLDIELLSRAGLLSKIKFINYFQISLFYL